LQGKLFGGNFVGQIPFTMPVKQSKAFLFYEARKKTVNINYVLAWPQTNLCGYGLDIYFGVFTTLCSGICCVCPLSSLC